MSALAGYSAAHNSRTLGVCADQVAASDTDPAVVNQALDALQPVVEALYSGVGAPASLSELDCLQMSSFD